MNATRGSSQMRLAEDIGHEEAREARHVASMSTVAGSHRAILDEFEELPRATHGIGGEQELAGALALGDLGDRDLGAGEGPDGEALLGHGRGIGDAAPGRACRSWPIVS